jgi:hypothetical protein
VPSLIAAIKDQFTDLDSPLHRIANLVQDGISATTDPAQRDGSDADTAVGSLARGGPAPSAGEVRDATLDVPGKVDHARAQADAQKALEAIDWSKPDISLWVPATGSHEIPKAWRDAVEQGPDAARTSLSLVDYPAGMDFNDSVATGMETLRLVMAGIAERGSQYRVTLGGHSQGAWVIGDTIATPEVGRMVDKAVLYGHPAPASVDWSGDADPNVRQVDDPQDPFTWDVVGGGDALNAISDLTKGTTRDGSELDGEGTLSRLGTLATTVLANPGFAAYLVGAHAIKDARASQADPHHYESQYADGAHFLAQ